MPVKDKLRHTINITGKNGQDSYGEPVAGTTTNSVACFIDGKFRRLVTDSGAIVMVDYSLLLLPGADIGIGYTVADGYDRFGVLLLAAGRVVGFEDSNHPKRGRVVREAFIARN